MLKIGSEQTLHGISVFSDSEEFDLFYLVGGRPAYRLDPDGKPSVSLFKYRFPVDRQDGLTGGGFLLMDVAFTVPDDVKETIREELQPQVSRKAQELGFSPPPKVRFGTIRYLDGSCNLIIAEAGGALVQKVKGSGKPSLYGENSAIFGVELTPEGATFFEQALQSGGPSIGLEYDLTAVGKLDKKALRPAK